MADLRIDIASEFTGKKAFSAADKASNSLNKSVLKLAKAFGPAILGAAVIKFGKDSVKAFIEDQKQAAKLAQVVKNLGLEFANPAIASYIDKLTLATGVADSQLRPAFQALLTTTGSLTKSQELLSLAIDTSRGSSIDLEQVAQDLSAAYVGKTKALAKYNLGLTTAELKTTKFVDIQTKLNDLYKGSSAAYLDTYAGKLELLGNAASEAQETIGGALIQSLMAFTGAVDAADLAGKIGGWSQSIAKFIDDFTYAFKKLSLFTSDRAILESFNPFSNYLQKGFAKIDAERVAAAFKRAMAGSTGFDPANNGVTGFKKDEAAKAKAEKDAAKRAKDLAAVTTKNTAELKKQTQLKKDGTVFDQQQIELIAALKGKLSDDDRRRAELQLALLNGNVSEADKLTKQILMATDSTGKLYQYFLQTPDAKNPFGYLDQWIKDFQQKLNNLQFPTATAYVPAGLAPELAAIGVVAGYGDYAGSVTNKASSTLGNGSFGMQSGGMGAVPNFIPDTSIYGSANGASQGPIALTISGDGQLTNAIADALQNKSLSTGNAAYINRRTGGFE